MPEKTPPNVIFPDAPRDRIPESSLKPEIPHASSLKRWEILAGIAALFIIGGILFFASLPLRKGFLPQREYAETVYLVPDKISQSAAILVILPKGIDVPVSQAKEKIAFQPTLDGQWSEGKNDRELVFHPTSKRELGKYYTIKVAAAEATVEKDFLIDEDPKIIAVFPGESSESPENSEITLVFNRPMVPLTTLDTLLEKDIPVEITPATPGKFKWISTRNMQFIPEKRLRRSSHYAVTVKSGFTSMDGLPVPPFTHRFTTRPLRYEGATIHHEGLTLYNEPVRIRFNQPVDLERTRPHIKVTKGAGGEVVSFIAEYGTREVSDDKTKAPKKLLDRSVLDIYSVKDRNGREKFWDFNTSYKLTIVHAASAEGDIELNESRSVTFQVPEVIAGLSADSPRSTFVEPDLFDPHGKLLVTFYEDIDKESSRIRADGLREIGYGEKCKESESPFGFRRQEECEKEADTKKLSLSFSPGAFGRGETIRIEFERIVNTAGVRLNADTIVKTITTFPGLRITKSIPAGGNGDAKLTELKLCTNTPLTPAEEENFYERVKSNLSVGKWNWHPPHRVRPENKISPCAAGEFENTILYSLIPETPYELSLNLRDDFEQALPYSLSFRTGKIPQTYYHFSHLQKVYNVTTPERTKLTYAVENLDYVNLHLCEAEAETMFRYLHFESRPKHTAPGEQLSCKRTFTRRIDLPQRYWVKNYFQVNMKDLVSDPLGHYIVSLSHPDYRVQQYDYRTKGTTVGEQIYERTFLTITNLAVQEKRIERIEGTHFDQNPSYTEAALAKTAGNLYWVSRAGSLDPVEGAKVILYRRERGAGPTASFSVFTDERGIARSRTLAGAVGAIVSKDKDSAIVSSELDKFQYASPVRSAERTYIYTDRPIYRPGQEVHIKGISRIGYDGEYEIFQDKKATVEVFNAKNQSIFKQDLEISDYGTFTADLALDTKAPLGAYRISGVGGFATFDVEEYAPSPFQLELSFSKDEYIAGDTLELIVDAHYYFGVPLEGGEAEYSILTQNYHFDRYRDGYFNFGRGWYDSPQPFFGDKFILRGKTSLDSQGRAKVMHALDFAKLFKEEEGAGSKIFVIRTTVRNPTGQAVSQEKSIIVHRGERYLGVNLEKSYFAKGESNKIRLKSVDIKGKGVSAGDIEVVVNKTTWDHFRRQEVDGRYYFRSEKKKEEVQKFRARTDANGDFSKDFTLDREGEYEVVARLEDDRRNPILGTTDFYVYGPRAVAVRQTNNEALDLAVEKNDLLVGEAAKIIIKSPYRKAKALVSVERGRVFEYEIVTVDRNLVDYTFTAKEAHIPNVFVSVLLLSPRPEIKYGQIQFKVNTKEKELDIAVRSDKNHYLPGEEVKLTVETRDRKGNAVSSEVSLAVADVSVLALKGNPKKNPVAFFYAGLPLGVVTSSNVKNILFEAEIPTGAKGGGGVSPEELAKKRRGVFRDTAFWKGVVHTGTDGRAVVSFTLPDNLTTWQTEAVGVTRDTKVGAGYKEFVTKKNLMVVPLKPRFVIPGDEFMIGAKVFNQTSASQSLEVSITSPSLELKGNTTEEISIKAGETRTLYFAARAPERTQDGIHRFTLSAKNKDYEDTVDQEIPIRRNDTYETVATAHFTPNRASREYLFLPEKIVRDRGGLTVKSSATLAVFLSDALNYLVSFPYGCSEQIASKLSSIAIVKRGLALPNIGEKFKLREVEFEGKKYTVDEVMEIGLARIYSNQHPRGGFTYYPNLEPNFHLTLHILNTLLDIKQAGYALNDTVLSRAARYVHDELLSNVSRAQDKNLIILTAYTLSRVDGFASSNDTVRNRALEILRDEKFIREESSTLTLAHAALLAIKGYPQDLKREIFQAIENRVSIDSRGAYAKERQGRTIYEYYETPIRNTAFFLKALVADRSENPITDKILRWLLKSRAKDGAWGSTNNTLAVVDALTDYLAWRRETESEFTISLGVNSEEKGKFDFNRTSIFDTFEIFMPVADFSPNRLHTIEFSKTNKNILPNTFYYDMDLRYFLPIDAIPPRDEGFTLTRELHRLDDEENKNPLREAKVGDVLRGHLVFTLNKERKFVAVENFIPAGMEIVNLRLATEDQSLRGKGKKQQREFYYEEGFGKSEESKKAAQNVFHNGIFSLLADSFQDFFAFISLPGIGDLNVGNGEVEDDEYSPRARHVEFFPDAEEAHDDRLFLFKERLGPGVYEFDYFVRALIPGAYHHLPAVASELYFPENFGRTRGEYFVITK